jgi:hypothetical protein
MINSHLEGYTQAAALSVVKEQQSLPIGFGVLSTFDQKFPFCSIGPNES